jgi:ABC-type transporter Mla subunit MlaD
VLLAGRKIGQVDKLYSPVTAKEAARATQAQNAPHPPPGESPAPPPAKMPKFEVRIDVQVDKSAAVYKDAHVRLTTLGLLGETAIDFTQGSETSGRAQDGEIFVGDRIPDFSEAVAKMLNIIEPVATSATGALKELQSTAQNLSRITDENSQMNMAIAQFRTFAENLTNLTARDSSLSLSLKNVEQISNQLTANDNITVTLQNFRTASEELKSALDDLTPDLKASGHNITDLTETLRAQPWRLIIPSTKKYPGDEANRRSETITVRKTSRRARDAEETPTPKPRRR